MDSDGQRCLWEIRRARPWSEWNSIVLQIREALRPCAGRNCYIALSYGSRFLVRALKRALSASARQWKPRFARSTLNTSLDPVRAPDGFDEVSTIQN